VRVSAVIHALDVDRLVPSSAQDIDQRPGAVTLRCDVPIALDDAAECNETGRFVLADAGVIVGGGLIDASRYPDQRHALWPKSRNLVAVDHHISASERRARAATSARSYG
jgi:sulfate adenylyltransferase subunit 1 (EFTu-like GTPase family)